MGKRINANSDEKDAQTRNRELLTKRVLLFCRREQIPVSRYRSCAVFNKIFSSKFCVQEVATAMQATGSVHRTPDQTHPMRTIFSSIHPLSPMHLCWFKISECVPKVIVVFDVMSLCVPDFSSFCTSQPTPFPSTTMQTGIR